MIYKIRIIASYGRACSGGGRWAANIGTGRPGSPEPLLYFFHFPYKDITKRVKSDFLRSLVRYLNEKLRPLNVKFSHFSYYIVTNITKLENKKNLNMTLKEMLLYKPFENLNISEGLNQREILNWKNNKDILDDLEKNKNTDV